MPPFPRRSSLVSTMLYRPSPNLPRLTLPLFGCPVRAGFPSPATDFVAEHLDLNEHLIAHKEATFLLRAKGLSMVGAGIQDGDRYQRAVCVVTVAGKDVGLQQIHQGLAWWYRAYAHEQRAQDRRDY